MACENGPNYHVDVAASSNLDGIKGEEVEIDFMTLANSGANALIKQFSSLRSCSISCKVAENWQSALKGADWDYWIFGSNCWSFASALTGEMCNSCP